MIWMTMPNPILTRRHRDQSMLGPNVWYCVRNGNHTFREKLEFYHRFSHFSENVSCAGSHVLTHSRTPQVSSFPVNCPVNCNRNIKQLIVQISPRVCWHAASIAHVWRTLLQSREHCEGPRKLSLSALLGIVVEEDRFLHFELVYFLQCRVVVGETRFRHDVLNYASISLCRKFGGRARNTL